MTPFLDQLKLVHWVRPNLIQINVQDVHPALFAVRENILIHVLLVSILNLPEMTQEQSIGKTSNMISFGIINV